MSRNTREGATPVDGEPARRARRVAVAVFVASLLAVGLLHWTLIERFGARTAARTERASMITARAATAVAQATLDDNERLRRALAEWQKEHPRVRAVRVADIENRSIEATTFAEDLKEGEPPRRMLRPEKELFDLGQELRANVDTNAAEGVKRLDETAVRRMGGGTMLIAVPLEREGEVAGFAQILATPDTVIIEPPNVLFAVAFALAPFVVILALSFVWTRSATPLAVIAALLLLVTLFAYRSWAVSSLVGGARAAEQRFSERLAHEAQIAARVAPGSQAASATWDADERRVPLRVDPEKAVAGEKEVIARTSYGIGAAALALLFFIGLGGAAALKKNLVEHRQAYVFVAPAMFGMLLLVFFPFVYGVALSFTGQTIYNVNKPYTEVWNGLQNYVEILGDFDVIRHTASGTVANYENFYYTLFFTIVWTICNVTIGVSVGLFLALLLNTKGLRGKTVYRVLLILPWALPNYITALIWKGMFHRQFGVINQGMALVGLPQVSWFEHPVTSFLTVLATNGWLSFPFMMVVSLGALQSISADLYEAARVDGATRWQQFRSITLPSLKPALVPAIILSVVWTFNMFNIIYLVSAGEPAHSTEILVTQAYKLAFEQYRYGYAAAYSTIIFAILLIYGVFQNRATRATEAIAG